MPELELLEKACPEARRFREDKHGPHRLVVRTSRCGHDNLGSNPSVGILADVKGGRDGRFLQECFSRLGCTYGDICPNDVAFDFQNV